MFHRFSTWWRALGVVLLSLATVTWPSAAQASTSATFSLVHQDVVVTLSTRGVGHFATTLALSPVDAGTRAQVAIFPRLIERSQIEPIVSNAGVTGRPASVTSTFSFKCIHQGAVKFSVGLFTSRPGPLHSPCASRAPQLRLHCARASCDGVYPLRFTITTKGVRVISWSLVAVQTTTVSQPLQVDLVETLDPSSWAHVHRTISVLDAISHHGSLPITLSADYRTLSRVQASSEISSQYQGAIDKALASPLHQIVNAPPGFIDFAGLATHGLGDQVRQQLSLSSNLLKALTGRYVDSPVLLSGNPSLASVVALSHQGVSNVVVPESDLSVAPSSTLTWGAPFHVPGTSSLSALATDGPLSQLVADQSIDPGRRAVLALATLDFLHFEAPFASAPRTIVIVAPIAKTSVRFVSDLLAGFHHNPFARLANLSPSFNSALIGTNGAPATRTVSSTQATSYWTGRNVSTLTGLISGVTSYANAISSSNVGTELRVAVATSESIGSPDARQAAISAASSSLETQLSNFTVDPSSITLAGPGTSLPITLLSRANYTVTAEVHLVTDRLMFPKGNTVVVVMDSPTKSLRIATSHSAGGSLTLQVVVTTPDDQVVLARAAVQVRITGTSIVGYVLTLAALLVLAYWWLRTYRRRSKGRHAR